MSDKNKNKGVADGERHEFQTRPGAAGSRTLKVRRIGNSLGVVLPREVLAKLRVGEGDALSVSETPDGIVLAPNDAETAELLQMAEAIMRKRRKVLKALAR
jgi:putative addiction module antidote